MNIRFLFLTAKRLLKFTTTHRIGSLVSVMSTVALIVTIGSAMSGAPKMSTQDVATSSSASSQQAASSVQRTKERIGSESIVITSHGFQPTEISRAPGRFFLHVQNRSGVNPLVWRVSAQSGSTLKEISVTSEHLDWADEVDPPAGQYTVTEVNHGWTCHLTITTAP